MRARIGVLGPAGNPTVELEFYRMAPAGSRSTLPGSSPMLARPGAPEAMKERTLGYLDALPVAIRNLAHVRPAAMGLAHTAVSYLNGALGEAVLAARLRNLTGTVRRPRPAR